MAAPRAQAQTPTEKRPSAANQAAAVQRQHRRTDFWNRSGVDLEVGGGGAITRYLSPSFDLAVLGYYETYKFSSQLQRRRQF